VAWQDLVARSAGVPAGLPERLVLASSVWLAYSADRWIEGWRLDPSRVMTHRHSFYQRNRWPIAGAWALVLAADLGVALSRLSPREISAGLVLLAGVAAYLLSHQLVHRSSRFRAPKEACVAVLLASGASVLVLARAGANGEAAAPAIGLFTLLCFTNCALISVWEHEVDRSHGQTSLALQMGRGAGLIRSLPWLAMAASAAAWFLCGPGARIPAACAASSALLLRGVDLAESRLGRVPARVLADLALLTPLVPVIARLLG
jgi:hypothetical protein